MKGIPIKFRAKRFDDGAIVYGINFTHTHEQDGEETVTWIGDIDNGWHIVVENSISQLCGYDMDGKEVYEGDKIYDAEHDDTVIAELYANVHLQFYRKVDV